LIGTTNTNEADAQRVQENKNQPDEECDGMQIDTVDNARDVLTSPDGPTQKASGTLSGLGSFMHNIGQFIGGHTADQEALYHQEKQFRQLEDQFRQRNNFLKARNEEQKMQIDRLTTQVQGYEETLQSLNKVIDKERSENTELRNHIFAVASSRAILKTDDHYVRGFTNLKDEIINELLEFSDEHAGRKISSAAEKDVLEQIAQLGPHGVKARAHLESSNYSLARFYPDDELRNSLIRHIAALFLLEKVFEPFAFGISLEFSEGLKSIEADFLERGTSFRNPAKVSRAAVR